MLETPIRPSSNVGWAGGRGFRCNTLAPSFREAASIKEVPELNNNRGNNRRRGRSNNSRPQNGGQQLNRIDSRARGNAPQLLEKYRKLAQDAHMNGDRVQAEYYLQFADHYFRVLADARVRQDEQRARPAGANGGERWQEQDGEDDGGDFSVEGDFLGFDRPPTRREREEREERAERPERVERPERAERPERNDRPERNERPEGRRDREDRPREDRPREDRPRDDRPRDDRPREDRNEGRRDGNRRFDRNRNRDAEGAAVEALPGEGIPAIEGEPITEAAENPFVREPRPARGLRPRTERGPRPVRDGAKGDDDAPATLDASFLPPSINVKADPEPEAAPAPRPAPAVAAEEAAPAPKKRGRPRKVVATEASEPVEG